ncbi:MAG: radical SAM protein [bacterium]
MKGEFNFQWHITNLCNLKCKHCYQSDFTRSLDIDWAKIKYLADNIIATLTQWHKSTRIDITGGEPLLKKEIFLLLEYLDHSPLVKETNIITNATLMGEDVLKRLTEFPKLKRIKVSLEGLKEQSCDAIRGNGVFKKVIKAMDLLQDKGLEVVLMFTVLKTNLEEIVEIPQFCKRHSIDGVILERFIPLGKGNQIAEEVLDQKDYKRLIELILKIIPNKFELDDFLPYKAFWIKWDKTIKILGAKCNIGDTLCIMPDGEVFPCRRFNLSIGNLLKDSLKNIYEQTALLKELKDKRHLKGKCSICSVSDCFGCRALALALTGDYFAQDSQCWW